MVAGEFLQLANVMNFNQAEADYFAVINGKTALFIGAICEIGGISAGAPDREIKALKIYGANLGLAFQIQDDLLDFQGDPDKTGKTVGNDFYEGKMTLPLIYTLKAAAKTESDFILRLLKGEKSERKVRFEEVREIISSRGGFRYSRQLAKKLIETGLAGLDIFSAKHDKKIVKTLIGLAHYVINRDK